MALYIGLISGTSTDAVDAALVEVNAQGVELVACHSEPIPEALARALRSAIDNQLLERSDFWQLDVRIGELFAHAALNLLEKKVWSDPEKIRDHEQPAGAYAIRAFFVFLNLLKRKTQKFA